MRFVEELFTRVTFDDADRAYHKELYAKVKEICHGLEEKCPHNEALVQAFNAFHLALMHVGTALSRAEKYKESIGG